MARANPRQNPDPLIRKMLTVREIKDVLREEHISISKRRGQNFLVDERIKKRIIDAIDLDSADYILEIGPGLGALTKDLAKGAKRVIAVEKDKGLVRILREQLHRYDNLQIIHQDILQFDMEKFVRKRIKIVGNLPYYITTPIVAYLFEKNPDKIKQVFITVQEEVGRRMPAKENSKDYSAFSIFVQYFAKPKVLFSIPKRAFYPQPRVNSVFVRLHMLSKPPVRINSQKQFFKIVHACFNQRRKTILNSLTHKLAGVERERIRNALKDGNFDSQKRPESLSLDEFAKIENIFYGKGIRL